MKILVNNLKNTQHINFKKQNNSSSSHVKTDQNIENTKSNLENRLKGLSTLGVATVIISKNDKINASIKNQNVIFEKGIAYTLDGSLFNGEIVKTNSYKEKFNILIKDGKILQSTKINQDGTVAWIKKYSRNKYNQNVTRFYAPNENSELELKKTILTGKDKIAMFEGENVVDKYWFNTAQGWKRVDEFIDKSDVKNYMNPSAYYGYNGIQINRFLRDGEFGHPNINFDSIPYEVLQDPESPRLYKEKVRDIMTHNRFILGAIDDLDLLTQTSKTDYSMIVYRNAPYWWVDKAEDGILGEDAFCSTSTKKGASMEGIYVGKHYKDGVTYKIHLPEGTPFLDLTHTTEKEMLLPRKGKFKVINNTELEYLKE